MVVNSEYTGLDFIQFINDNKFFYNHNDFSSNSWGLQNTKLLKIQRKMESDHKTLEEMNTKIRLGIATGSNEVFIISENQKNEFINKNPKNKEIIKPILRGRDIGRYYYNFDNLYLLLTKNGIDVEKDYPDIFEYLNCFDERFKNRGAKGEHWTNLRACSFFDDFYLEKIVWIELTDKGRFTIATDEIYLLNSAYFLLAPTGINPKYLLSILNSRIIGFYLKMIANTSGVGTTRWINNYVKEFPIPEIPLSEQQPFIDLADQMLSLNEQLQLIQSKFVRLLERKFEIEPSKALLNWQNLSFKEFVKELAKKKVKLSLADEVEWEEFFLAEQQKALSLQADIDSTDRTIDAKVYALYGLDEDEIALIESC